MPMLIYVRSYYVVYIYVAEVGEASNCWISTYAPYSDWTLLEALVIDAKPS